MSAADAAVTALVYGGGILALVGVIRGARARLERGVDDRSALALGAIGAACIAAALIGIARGAHPFLAM